MNLTKCFKALSDKTRLRLLYILNRYELSVKEVVLVVDMIQSGVSRHLKILVESGLLTSRRDGSFIYYSAAKDEKFQVLIDFVDNHLEGSQTAREDLQKAHETLLIRQNRSRRFFSTVAPGWDRRRKEVFGAFDLYREIQTRISENGNICDLGCGTGELIQRLIGPGVRQLIGVDSSPEMLDQARLKLAGTVAELRLGELEFLPMKNRQMDTAVMNMVLHHIHQPRVPIAEAYRVLKPGGFFILADFEKHTSEKVKKLMGGIWMGFEKQQICSWLKKTGFFVEESTPFPVQHGLTINVYVAKKT